MSTGEDRGPLLFGDRWRGLRLLKSGDGVDTWLAHDVRGADDDPERVVVKAIAATALSATARLRLEHEAHVLARLQQGGITSKVLTDPRDGVLYFVRPYLEGSPLKDRLEAAGPLSVFSALRLGLDVLETLQRAHRLGVLHRDIKPANLIVDDGEPLESASLIDFGLARSTSLAPAIRDELVGTVRYVAPEAAGLLDGGVDERADLYSVGVVLFEALAGDVPFRGDTVGEVLRHHLNSPAPHLSEVGVAIPRALDAVIQRLLAKDPGERYQSAAAARADLAAIATSLEDGIADPVITIGLHDNRRTLTAPAFVGRSAELATVETLVDVAREGHGGLVLLEAESGGGKTRLLDEVELKVAEPHIRIRVIRGQGVDHAAQRPFQLLEGIAAAIMQDLEKRPGSVADLRDRLGDRVHAVAAALPALATALVPDSAPDQSAASLGPESFGETRNLQALRTLLGALGDRRRPAVLLLDDCQWADTLTIKLLTQWQQQLHDAPAPAHVLVVAAFRSEEVGPAHGLRGVTPLAHVSLDAFCDDDVAQLCESMAGPLPHDVLETVTRLAEGSPFMASAVLRGLVEAGALCDTEGGWTVDPTRLADVQTSRRAASFLVRRLELLAPAALTLMSTAAVLGKEFDLDLALALAGLDSAGAVTALEEARRRRILWVDERTGRGSFTHDKLREALLDRLEGSRRQALHLLAAAHYEASGSAEPGGDPDVAFELAYHFDAAGEGTRATPYALRAAEVARSRHALDIAVAHYRIAERAARFAANPAPTGARSVVHETPDDDEATRAITRAIIAEGLGDVLTLQGEYDTALEQLRRALSLRHDPIERAELEAKLGDVAFKQGQPAEAREHLESALRQLGRWVPRSTVGFLLGALWELVVQAAHTAAPRVFLARRPLAGSEGEFLAIRTYSRLAYVFWFHAGKVPCGWAHLREMNMAERYPPTEELAQSYSEHAPVATMVPWYARGVAYANRSLAIRRNLGDPWGEGQSLHFYGVVLYAASKYRECIDRCREAIRLLERTGDKWEENTASWHLAICHYRLGDLATAVRLARALHFSAAEIGDRAAAGITLGIWARASCGRVPAALIEPLLGDTDDAHTATEVHTAEALRLMHEGNLDGAEATLRRALDIIRRAGLRQEYVAPAYPWFATVLRLQAETAGLYTSRRNRRRLIRRARRAANRAVRVARSYQNNAPHAFREQALTAAIGGRTKVAVRRLQRSIDIAAEQGASYEKAQSELALARLRGDIAAIEAAGDAVALLEAPIGEVSTAVVEPTLSLVDRFSSLLDVGRMIAAAPSPEAVYAAVRHAALILLRGDSCHVFAVPADRESTSGAHGVHRFTTSGNEVDALSQRLIAEAIAGGIPVVADAGDRPERASEAGANAIDGATDSRDSGAAVNDLDDLDESRSILCAPVHCDEEVVACFYVTHHRVRGLFGADEIRLAEFIATLAGAALEHSAGSEARFRSLAQNSTDVITIVDANGTVTYQSSSVHGVFGFEPAEFVGRQLSHWVHPDDANRLLGFLRAPRARGAEESTRSTVLIESRLRHKDGSWRNVETGLNDLTADPSVRGFVLNTRDISERVALEAELRTRAWHDGLTGLANRELFTDRVEHALARHERQQSCLAVLFLDLDDFKSINDSLGHRAGDLLLIAVGRVVQNCVRPSDTVARFGGDEFAILLEDAPQADAETVAGRVMEALSQSQAVLGHEIHARASLGLAMSERGQSVDDLLANADVAMYAAKALGKTRYEIFEPAMRSEALERSGLRTDLEWALERDELKVHYQPVIDLATGAVAGFEALLRWDHPRRGLLAPANFIDLAESSGLIVPIGAWVLRESCRQARLWRDLVPDGPWLSMAVNVSARQLQRQGLVDHVESALRDFALPPECLVLEITESATVQDTEAVMEKLSELRQLGVGIAIDDFGTGYSSFSYLRRFPVDLLKIDRSFVEGLGRDGEDSAIVHSVVALAHTLGLKAVAEGVETIEQLELLTEMGCDHAQGYNWRRPAPADEVGIWLALMQSDAAPADGAANEAGTRRRLPRVLLVDDQASVRAAVRLAMEIDGGFEIVCEAADGAEAVSSTRRHQPDLVLLDLKMPGLSGADAFPAIREAAPGAGIVLLTAAEPYDVPDQMRTDALGLFDKAVGLDRLVQDLSTMLADALPQPEGACLPTS